MSSKENIFCSYLDSFIDIVINLSGSASNRHQSKANDLKEKLNSVDYDDATHNHNENSTKCIAG